MGWLGIPLGVATSMFAGMTLGVGVDSTLHLLERFERMRTLGGALSSAGPPILIDTLSTSLGFAVLLLSRVPANERLGGLLSLSLLAGLAATLLIVPALLAHQRFRFADATMSKSIAAPASGTPTERRPR